MAKDIIKIKLKGATILSSEDEIMKNLIVNAITTLDGEFSTVTLTPTKGKPYKAIKFVLNKFEILTVASVLYIWLHKGTEIFITK